MNITALQNLYQQYSFLEPSEAGREGEAVTGAITQWLSAKGEIEALIKRTYELPAKWYFIVAKPFDRAYEKDPSWYLTKGIESIRRKVGKCHVAFLTREVNAAKVHVNALICKDELSIVDGQNTNKYKLHVSELSDISERRRVLDYISKEATTRTFIKYLDYVLSASQR